MITLLHGDDTRKSREALFQLKQNLKGKEVRDLAGKTLQDQDLMQALSSSSLFGGDTVVIIENIFSGLGKKLKRTQELAAILKDNNKEIDIILWEEKEIGKTALAGLGNEVTQKLFKLPTIIFQFLDSIAPKNSASLLSLYRTLTATEPPDLIHAMLVKRIKQLLMVKSGHTPEGQQSWQLTRLTNQTRAFTLEQLISLYQKCKKIEYNRNSGQGVFDVREATELMLINI